MFIDGGAALIQIRDKILSSREFFEDASAAVKIAHKANVRVLINDRVDIALMSGADGVHLGHDDLPSAAARRILGVEAIIGVSTHSLEQVQAALREGKADYIAFGPIFSSFTKTDHEPVVGLEGLKRVREFVEDVPIVAIGGINSANLAGVRVAGADSVAMISEFYRSESDISSHFRFLLQAAEE